MVIQSAGINFIEFNGMRCVRYCSPAIHEKVSAAYDA